MNRPEKNMQNPEQIKQANRVLEVPEQNYLKRIAVAMEGIEKELKKLNNNIRSKK